MNASPVKYPWGTSQPGLWSALRMGATAVLDDLRHVGLVNVAAAILAGGLAALALRVPVVTPLLLVLVPVMIGMARMAGTVVRGGAARFDDFRAGASSRWGAVLGLAAVAMIVAGVALANLAVVDVTAGVLAVAAMVLSVWVLALELILALAAAALLGDPLRQDTRFGDLARLVVAVVGARPLRMLGLTSLIVVLAGVAAQTWVGWFILPAIGVMTSAHAVIPIADTLAPVDVVPSPTEPTAARRRA